MCAVSLIRRDFSTDTSIDATPPRALDTRECSQRIMKTSSLSLSQSSLAVAEAADVLYRRVCVCVYVVRVGCAAYASHQHPAECSVLQSKQNSARAKIN